MPAPDQVENLVELRLRYTVGFTVRMEKRQESALNGFLLQLSLWSSEVVFKRFVVASTLMVRYERYNWFW